MKKLFVVLFTLALVLAGTGGPQAAGAGALGDGQMNPNSPLVGRWSCDADERVSVSERMATWGADADVVASCWNDALAGAAGE